MPRRTTQSLLMLYLGLVLAAGRYALAILNDWSIPCTEGECHWEIPDHKHGSGALKIWGSSTAISDITNATGWQIVTNCHPNSTTQEINLVCKDGNPDCDHLFQGGAEHTIVRLPDDCGPMPFARVAQHQILPSKSNTSSRTDELPVHMVTLDTNFAAGTSSRNGEVNFAIVGRNAKAEPDIETLKMLASNSSDEHVQRDIVRRFQYEKSFPGDFVDFDRQKTLFEKRIPCSSPTDGYIVIAAHPRMMMAVSLGAATAGSLIPPKLSKFMLTYGLDGHFGSSINLLGALSGKVETTVDILDYDFPAIDFGGVLTLNPAISVSAQLSAGVQVPSFISSSLQMNHNLNNLKFAFPPYALSPLGSPDLGFNNYARLSSAPQVNFNMMGRLIASLGLRMKVLDGLLGDAGVYAAADASTNAYINAKPNMQHCKGVTFGFEIYMTYEGRVLSSLLKLVLAPLFQQKYQLLGPTCTDQFKTREDADDANLIWEYDDDHPVSDRALRHRDGLSPLHVPVHPERDDSSSWTCPPKKRELEAEVVHIDERLIVP